MCIFCRLDGIEIIHENELALCFSDKYPVTEGHSLIIPRRHMEDQFQATHEETAAIMELIKIRREELLSEDESIDGFNIGVNCGLSAGQTIFHLHWHLIPRRTGDMENPAGGVRGVIPERRAYPSS